MTKLSTARILHCSRVILLWGCVQVEHLRVLTAPDVFGAKIEMIRYIFNYQWSTNISINRSDETMISRQEFWISLSIVCIDILESHLGCRMSNVVSSVLPRRKWINNSNCCCWCCCCCGCCRRRCCCCWCCCWCCCCCCRRRCRCCCCCCCRCWCRCCCCCSRSRICIQGMALCISRRFRGTFNHIWRWAIPME